MPKIIFTTSSFDLKNCAGLDQVQAAGYEVVVNPLGRRLKEDEAAAFLADGVVGMVAGVEPLTASVLNAAASLKVISRCGIGLDSVDLDAAKQRGIAVFNTPGAPTLAVAELTLAHLLSMLRRVAESDRGIRRGEWKPLMGSLLAKQTVGLIGYGRIGRKVGELVRAFGAKVVVHDPISAPAESVSLEDLAAAADVVSLHVPYMADNHHLIDAGFLGRMKQGALLLNISRGGLVDEQALLEALNSGHLGGAALDCFETEPYNGPLSGHDRVQCTAHMGSYAQEARALMEAEAWDNLVLGLKNAQLL